MLRRPSSLKYFSPFPLDIKDFETGLKGFTTNSFGIAFTVKVFQRDPVDSAGSLIIPYMLPWADMTFIVDTSNSVSRTPVAVVDALLWMIVSVVETGITVAVDFITEGERGPFWPRWGEQKHKYSMFDIICYSIAQRWWKRNARISFISEKLHHGKNALFLPVLVTERSF